MSNVWTDPRQVTRFWNSLSICLMAAELWPTVRIQPARFEYSSSVKSLSQQGEGFSCSFWLLYLGRVGGFACAFAPVYTTAKGRACASYLQRIKASDDSPVLHLAALGGMGELALGVGASARAPLKLSTHLQRQPFRVPHVSHVHRHVEARFSGEWSLEKIPTYSGCVCDFPFVLLRVFLSFLDEMHDKNVVRKRENCCNGSKSKNPQAVVEWFNGAHFSSVCLCVSERAVGVV